MSQPKVVKDKDGNKSYVDQGTCFPIIDGIPKGIIHLDGTNRVPTDEEREALLTNAKESRK